MAGRHSLPETTRHGRRSNGNAERPDVETTTPRSGRRAAPTTVEAAAAAPTPAAPPVPAPAAPPVTRAAPAPAAPPVVVPVEEAHPRGTAARAVETQRTAARPSRASRPVVATRPRAVTRAPLPRPLVTRIDPTRPDPGHVRRTMRAQRLALIVAPVIAMTSCITFAMPANAATADDSSVATPSSTISASAAPHRSQTFTVSKDVEVPVVDNGITTVVSYPAVVVSGGASEADAETAISRVLSAGGQRAQIVQTALAYLGDTYVEGGASHAGIDCSGLVMVAYASVGIPLVHYVPTQDDAATTIPESEAQPGDLVVYDNEEHIGLFLGDGLVLQAPHPGEPVDIIPMFSAAHHFARVLPAS